MHPLGRTLALRLLTCIIIMLPDSSSSCMDGKETLPPTEVNTSLSVQMGTKAVLCCPFTPPTRKLILKTWRIILKDKTSCRISHKGETNETMETNCADGRITWVSRPGQDPHLQIHPVAISHEGFYKCEIITTDGNFDHGYHLQVLVSPAVTLLQRENRIVVCKAVAGRPAAQIFWTPKGDCVTEKQQWDNDTVMTRSMCYYPDGNVSTVTCLVSHPTGNRSLLTDLLPDSSSLCIVGKQMTLPPTEGLRTSESPETSLLIILYVKLSFLVVVLVIVGFTFFQRINDRRE